MYMEVDDSKENISSREKGTLRSQRAANAVERKDRSNRYIKKIMTKQTNHESAKHLLLLCVQTNEIQCQFITRTVTYSNRERRRREGRNTRGYFVENSQDLVKLVQYKQH